MTTTVSARARVRARNQVTIPESIVLAASIEEGETLIVELETAHPDVLRVRRVRESYAGALPGLYADAGAYLEEERSDW